MNTSVRPSASVSIDEAQLRLFREYFRGSLLLPVNDEYDAAREVWNAMVDRRPALIARCTCADDVMAAVDFAREQGLIVSIKGGGHSVSGSAVADGALMIDLSSMKAIEIDPETNTARAEPGVTWQEFDTQAGIHGLATVGGTVSSTGIAGLTLGGGQGWLTGKYGLTLDNLLSVEVVTASGQRVRVSGTDNPDLFWAMRGAGANFGVATQFVYQLHPVDTIFGGMVIHPIERADDVLRFYREFAASQPDDLTTYAALLTGPSGDPVVAMVSCYAGPAVDAELILTPLRGFGQPVADTFVEMSYPAMQVLLDASFPYKRRNYWKSGMTSYISDAMIDSAIDAAHRFPTPYAVISIADCHGAYTRVGSSDTAYPHRDLQFDFMIFANWIEQSEDERNIAWARDLYATVGLELGAGIYVNDLGSDGGREAVRRAYRGNHERLVALKRRYDPTNFFRLNQNIVP